MNKHQHVFAIVFMVALFGFAAFNIWNKHDELKTELEAIETPKTMSEAKRYTASIDTVLTSNLAFDKMWNEAYASVHNVFDKNEENSFKYVRDKNGYLYAGNFWNVSNVEAKEFALRIKRLEAAVEERDTEVIVLLYPTQYNEEWTEGHYGIPYNDYNEFTDQLLRYFRYYNIEHIDFREIYLEKELHIEDIFYKTDHHWTTQRAFEGFQILTEHLNTEHNEGLDTYYTNTDNYIFETHKDTFMGSQGRDAGLNYVGLDDYTFILPKFQTSYEYTYRKGSEDIHVTGDIEETLISKEYLQLDDYYDRDMWKSYVGGIYKYDEITNLLNEDGLDVLFLRDSYTSPLATFFSSYCSNVNMVWTAQTDPLTIQNVVEAKEYDYIFIAMSVDSFVNDGANFYMYEEENDG